MCVRAFESSIATCNLRARESLFFCVRRTIINFRDDRFYFGFFFCRRDVIKRVSRRERIAGLFSSRQKGIAAAARGAFQTTLPGVLSISRSTVPSIFFPPPSEIIARTFTANYSAAATTVFRQINIKTRFIKRNRVIMRWFLKNNAYSGRQTILFPFFRGRLFQRIFT